jgi:hypothetical protein
MGIVGGSAAGDFMVSLGVSPDEKKNGTNK